MANMVLIIILVLLLAIYALMFWYWIRTSLIMLRQSVLLGVLGFLFSPLAQLIYYFSNKNKLSMDDKKEFNRYWLVIVLTIVVSIIGAMVTTYLPIQ